MHLNAVGGDCPGKTELHADILLRPDARVVGRIRLLEGIANTETSLLLSTTKL